MLAPLITRSLLLEAPRRITWVEERLPNPGPHDLLLRTRAGAISLGTELPLYLGRSRSSPPPRYPAMTGYESVAEVVACGSAVQTLARGDRVVAFYGHRTAAIVPESRVVPIPPDIPDSEALLLILACDAAKGISKAPLHPHTRIAITGSGTMGLLTLFNLHARGLRQCVVVDPLPQRRQLASALGAHAAYDPSDPQLASHRCHVGFECSSRDSAFQLLQELLLPEGHLCVLADGNLEPLTLTPDFHSKELSVVGSSDGLEYKSYAPWFWERVRTDAYPLQCLFEQRIDAVQLPEVFEQLAMSDVRPIKVFVSYLHEETRSL